MRGKITAAQPIRYDERTDCREPWGPSLGKTALQELTDILNHEEEVSFLQDGLLGWGEYTHTLYLENGCCYHVRIEEAMTLLYAQVVDKGRGRWQYSGHAIVLEAEDPHTAAGLLVDRLKKEGAAACRGCVGHSVYEIGNPAGPFWCWLPYEEAETGRFRGCRDCGPGAYYRGRPSDEGTR